MSENKSAVGRHIYLEPIIGLQVRCIITDEKTPYGRTRYEVTPVAGSGRAWVLATNTRPCPETRPETTQTGGACGTAR